MNDDFVRVASVADVAPGTAAAVTVGEREIALFHADGAFYALKNACSHQGGPLCEGRIEGKTVTCPWHALVFDLETGKVVRGLARVEAFDVRVEDGEVAVRATPRPRRPSRSARPVSEDFVRVARVGDVAPGSAIAVTVGRREIALFHVEGELYAMDNTCPHQGGPLCEGRIEGKTVTCPLHAWTFKLESGRMALGDYALVDTFDVRVEGDDIVIARTPRPRRGAR